MNGRLDATCDQIVATEDFIDWLFVYAVLFSLTVVDEHSSSNRHVARTF